VVEARREDRTTNPFEFVEKDGHYCGRGTQDVKVSDAAAGDLVTAKLREPIRASDKVLAPAGAVVRGRIVQMQHWVRWPRHFTVAIRLEKLEVSGGSIPLYAIGDAPEGQSRQDAAFVFWTHKDRYIVPANYQTKWVTVSAEGQPVGRGHRHQPVRDSPEYWESCSRDHQPGEIRHRHQCRQHPGDVHGQRYVLAGADPGDFVISANTCGPSLATNTSCTVSIEFKPTAIGTRTATLEFNDDGAPVR
jgi:hypothetical protein